MNIINDTLLHYACKKNNLDVVNYILSKDPQAANKMNKYKKYPVNLATSEPVIAIFKRNSQLLKKPSAA